MSIVIIDLMGEEDEIVVYNAPVDDTKAKSEVRPLITDYVDLGLEIVVPTKRKV